MRSSDAQPDKAIKEAVAPRRNITASRIFLSPRPLCVCKSAELSHRRILLNCAKRLGWSAQERTHCFAYSFTLELRRPHCHPQYCHFKLIMSLDGLGPTTCHLQCPFARRSRVMTALALYSPCRFKTSTALRPPKANELIIAMRDDARRKTFGTQSISNSGSFSVWLSVGGSSPSRSARVVKIRLNPPDAHSVCPVIALDEETGTPGDPIAEHGAKGVRLIAIVHHRAGTMSLHVVDQIRRDCRRRRARLSSPATRHQDRGR